MQQNDDKMTRPHTRPRIGRTRFVEIQPDLDMTGVLPTTGDLPIDPKNDQMGQTINPISNLPQTPMPATGWSGIWRNPSQTLHLGRETAELPIQPWDDARAAHLLQLSGMMRSVRVRASSSVKTQQDGDEHGYWPLGIQQTGPLPVFNLYGRGPIGRTLPMAVSVVLPNVLTKAEEKAQPAWLKIPASPIFKFSLGIFVGLDLLFLASRFVNLPLALQVIQMRLTTLPGIALGLLAALILLGSTALRGLRWKLFLNSVGNVSLLKVIALCQIAAFLNFLLPIFTGEAARSLMLKRIANIPVSKSVPVVAMDKSLDIVAALVVVALMPLLGIPMDLPLWLVFGVACLLLLVLGGFVALLAWKGSRVSGLVHRFLGSLPAFAGGRIESFFGGLVTALLAGARRPLIFVPALLLTGLALVGNGFFILLVFWTLGYSVAFAVALCGYALSLFFSLLPVPPGQLGSSELVGLFVFTLLFGLSGDKVLAVFLFAHLWMAVLLTASGLICLKLLGLNISAALHFAPQDEKLEQ